MLNTACSQLSECYGSPFFVYFSITPFCVHLLSGFLERGLFCMLDKNKVTSPPGTITECLPFPLCSFLSDHQKLEREARICRLLKHPNIGE